MGVQNERQRKGMRKWRQEGGGIHEIKNRRDRERNGRGDTRRERNEVRTQKENKKTKEKQIKQEESKKY
jgi:hypothetical protein